MLKVETPSIQREEEEERDTHTERERGEVQEGGEQSDARLALRVKRGAGENRVQPPCVRPQPLSTCERG